jgi:hypothetical protein
MSKIKASDILWDIPLPGTLLNSQTVNVSGGDFATATKSNAVNIPGLSIVYTPPVNCRGLVLCQVRLSVNVALVRVAGVININTVQKSRGDALVHTAGDVVTTNCYYLMEMVANTAYTILGQLRQLDLGGAQTCTALSATDMTQMSLIAIKKP